MTDRDELGTQRDVTSRRNPFELWIVLACILTGTVALLPLDTERSGVIDRYLPVLAIPWYVGLLVAGGLALIGTSWRVRTVSGILRALAWERVGLILLSGLMLGYGGAVIVTTPQAPAALLMIGLGVASAARVRQITHEVHLIAVAFSSTCRNEDEDSVD